VGSVLSFKDGDICFQEKEQKTGQKGMAEENTGKSPSNEELKRKCMETDALDMTQNSTVSGDGICRMQTM